MRKIAGKIIAYLDGPKEIVYHMPYIRLVGNEEIHIENFQGIQVYTEVCIRIKTTCGVLSIEGNQLEAKYMDSESIFIRGQLKVIQFIV